MSARRRDTFFADSLKADAIRDQDDYDGIRIKLYGLLGQTRIPIQIDIGFGDVITPNSEDVDFPTLLDGPAPRLKAYPKYTMVAEKMEAIVKLGTANSRMKDFYDVWLMSKLFEFDGLILSEAVANTFSHRRTHVPTGTPVALTDSFYNDKQKMTQWNAFIRKAKPDSPVDDFSQVIIELSAFLMPVLANLGAEMPYHKTWIPEQGWQHHD